MGGLDIRIDLDHAWPGDLRITLEHAGRVLVIWDRQDDLYGLGLEEALQTDAFDGLDAQGAWTLTLSDHAAQDTGTLHAWSLTL